MANFTRILKSALFFGLSVLAGKNSSSREKSNKQFLKDSNINKMKVDKFGTVKDPFAGKDYADYKMPRNRKNK
ncbi:MAG: hypothetical protein PHN88_04690 [Ignavibacteria bacterium]|nr:hypothetical protein [Ignavibacteria bacterium]